MRSSYPVQGVGTGVGARVAARARRARRADSAETGAAILLALAEPATPPSALAARMALRPARSASISVRAQRRRAGGVGMRLGKQVV
ncbi:hypothetical protein [Nonomuraea rubra]|uniref:hypothetical protein n=1 Tax=Nonomuraea rubra TaxID=46180 RepID=UPI0031E7C549